MEKTKSKKVKAENPVNLVKKMGQIIDDEQNDGWTFCKMKVNYECTEAKLIFEKIEK